MRTFIATVLLALAPVSGAALVVAPLAHADRTVTAGEACRLIKPGSHPLNMGAIFTFDVTCVRVGEYGYTGSPPQEPMTAAMARELPGAYRVQPGNPWSDWVIPG